MTWPGILTFPAKKIKTYQHLFLVVKILFIYLSLCKLLTLVLNCGDNKGLDRHNKSLLYFVAVTGG